MRNQPVCPACAYHFRAQSSDTSARGSWQMDNLLGEDLHRLPALYSDANKAVHLYGKTEARNGRKMGHVTGAR